jgi:hypothetical protein
VPQEHLLQAGGQMNVSTRFCGVPARVLRELIVHSELIIHRLTARLGMLSTASQHAQGVHRQAADGPQPRVHDCHQGGQRGGRHHVPHVPPPAVCGDRLLCCHCVAPGEGLWLAPHGLHQGNFLPYVQPLAPLAHARWRRGGFSFDSESLTIDVRCVWCAGMRSHS